MRSRRGEEPEYLVYLDSKNHIARMHKEDNPDCYLSQGVHNVNWRGPFETLGEAWDIGLADRKNPMLCRFCFYPRK